MSDPSSIFEPQQDVAYSEVDRLQIEANRAASWAVSFRPPSSCAFFGRARTVHTKLKSLEEFLTNPPAFYKEKDPTLSACRAAVQELRANFGLLRSAISGVADRPRQIAALPRVAVAGHQDEPRIAAVSSAYVRAVEAAFSPATFNHFIRALQAHESLTLLELWGFAPFLKFALLESLLDEANSIRHTPESVFLPAFYARTRSLRDIGNADWNSLIEPLISFDSLLLQDPAGAYRSMDFDSREFYRKRVAMIARRSDCTEAQVAQTSLDLAHEAAQLSLNNPRLQRRMVHVGHYLIGKGFPQLASRVGFHPPVSWRLRQFVLDRAEDFYITGIQLLSVLFIAVALFPVLPSISSFSSLTLALCVLLLPAMQIAVELVNNLITSFFDPSHLPKLDFSMGIPPDSTTLVAVPSLLLNQVQVQELVTDLEVRYLANRDPHLHFALVTDLPDSVSKPHENDAHPLVDLAIRLIGELNAKYRSQKGGAFLLLHRHRIFNTREGVWMGWERKRGKLLDLNKLLSGDADAFPIKSGAVGLLPTVRYILTLDSDTQLPRGTAAMLAGAIAHPLNQAVVDPKSRTVVEGYGILQPRMGVTVRSAARSRLAAIYSGQSGFDIYSRAISEPYQDLFGEGIFTGKGIYEVAILHQVLNRRFPRNALLSHDLIEGAYARAGLVTDVELVDDYPSCYNAYSRRQHRWLRGDWQVAQWMFSRVPDESGRRAPNPISGISRWKIFDNLRRSLFEISLLLLFVAGWLGLPGGALYWTIVPLILLIFPALAQLVFGIGRSLASGQKDPFSQAISAFWQTALISFFHLVFLAQHAFLAFDAIFRSLIRRFITGERLLEWETSAQAELESTGPRGIDRYVGVMPLLSAALAALVWCFAARKTAILCAAPILLLWAVANPVTAWLNRPPCEKQRLKPVDIDFLLLHALRIWRYFSEFGCERHNYLIPDNVEEEGLFEASRISPTNIGMLLNARQAACELGFITTPEFAALTSLTLATITRLKKFRGHLYNWYDTQTLQPLGAYPSNTPFVSTVDSGNIAASLFTLHAGARDLAKRPLLPPRLFTGLHAHWQLARKENHLPNSLAQLRLPAPSAPAAVWVAWLPTAQTVLSAAACSQSATSSLGWWMAETQRRVEAILVLVRDYQPWILPEYEPLCALPQLDQIQLVIDCNTGSLSIEDALLFALNLDLHLAPTWPALADKPELAELCERLRASLRLAMVNLQVLADSLRSIGQQSEQLAQEMDFAFLVNPDRQMLAIGYDTGARRIHENCYDLIASEARVATFLAIARGDLPQPSWFKLARDYTYAYGRTILLSWTGTMFEYLMPALWMRSYPNTLIAQTQNACVQVQRAFALPLNAPWGISESGYSQRDSTGHYRYHAFGVPRIAISDEAKAGPVISPYSTFLALSVDCTEALRNLRRMAFAGWAGAYGYYEAADYTRSAHKPVMIREWMAHHQGMSLLAIVNLLRDGILQRWFHENPLVRSTERLLHEAPVSKAILRSRLDQLTPIRSG
jgi:cyclic beta-1,2-glucan synthetase